MTYKKLLKNEDAGGAMQMSHLKLKFLKINVCFLFHLEENTPTFWMVKMAYLSFTLDHMNCIDVFLQWNLSALHFFIDSVLKFLSPSCCVL